jgi:hypothetical protein
MTLALAATAAQPARATGPQNKALPHGTAESIERAELNADGSLPDAVAKAGVETRALQVWDCDQTNRAPVVWARADHGIVSVKSITSGPGCGRLSMTMAGIFYTSEPGFKGTDKIYVLGFYSNGHRFDNIATVLVK